MSDIFISYSQKDEFWRGLIEPHLEVLGNAGISVWSDQQIDPGTNWMDLLQEVMKTARITVMLISKNYLTSGFVKRSEIPVILQRRKDEGMLVYPILVTPCAWKTVPWLEHMQVQHQKGLSLLEIPEEDREGCLSGIAEQIAGMLALQAAKSAEVPSQGRPILGVIDAESTILLDEDGNWFFQSARGALIRKLPPLGLSSCHASDEAGKLTVGLYEYGLATLRQGNWDQIPSPLNAAVLCITPFDDGVIAGDTAGNIILLQGKKTPRVLKVVDQPITGLLAVQEDLLILGSRGGVWVWSRSRTATAARPIEIKGFEGPFSAIPGPEPESVALVGADRLALLKPEEYGMGPVSKPIGRGIQYAFRNRSVSRTGCFAVLTDEGRLFLVSSDLSTLRQVRFHPDESPVTGLQPAPGGGFLAWTVEGNLFRVRDNLSFMILASDKVALAIPGAAEDRISIVHWEEGESVKLSHLVSGEMPQ